MVLNRIMDRYSSFQLHEIERWIDEWIFDWTVQTICDTRKHVESVLWKWNFTNFEIVDWIIRSWWIFTNRHESDTWDICYVNLDDLIENLKNTSNN